MVCFQEHWLLPSELGILSDLHKDFFGFGYSAVDVYSNILVGRPYCGSVILYRKGLASSIKFIEYMDSRFTPMILSSTVGPILVISVLCLRIIMMNAV